MATLNDMSTWAVHTRGGLREFFTKEGKHCVEQNRAENGRWGSWPVKAMTGRASFDGLIPEKATPCKWTRVGLPDKDRRRAGASEIHLSAGRWGTTELRIDDPSTIRLTGFQTVRLRGLTSICGALLQSAALLLATGLYWSAIDMRRNASIKAPSALEIHLAIRAGLA